MVVIKYPVDNLILGKFRKKVRTGFLDNDIAIHTVNLKAHTPWQINREILTEFFDNLWQLGIRQLVGLEIYANYDDLAISWLFTRETFKSLFSKEFINQLASSFAIMDVKKYLEVLPKASIPTKYKEFHLSNDFVFPLKSLQKVIWLDNILDYLLAIEKGDHIIIQFIFRPFPDIWHDYAQYYINQLFKRRRPVNFVRFMYQQGPITGLLRHLALRKQDRIENPRFFKNSIELIKQRMNEHLFQTIIRLKLQSVYTDRLEELDKWSTKIMQAFDNTPFNALVAVQHRGLKEEFEARILPPARFNLLSTTEMVQFLLYTDKDRSQITKPISIEVNTSLLSLPIDKGITIGEVSVNGIRHNIGILPEDKRRNIIIFSDTNKYLLHLLTNLITGEFNFGLKPLSVIIGDSRYGIFKALAHVLKRIYPDSPFIPLGHGFKFSPFGYTLTNTDAQRSDNTLNISCDQNYNLFQHILLEYTDVYKLPLLNELLRMIVKALCAGLPLAMILGLLLKPGEYLKDVESHLPNDVRDYWHNKYIHHLFKDPDLKAEILDRVIMPLMHIVRAGWFADKPNSNYVIDFRQFFSNPQLLFIDVKNISELKDIHIAASLLVSHIYGLHNMLKESRKEGHSKLNIFKSSDSNERIQTLSFYVLTDVGGYTNILTAKPVNLTMFKAWKDTTHQINKVFSRLNNRIYLPIPFAQRVLLGENLIMPPALKKQVLNLTSGYALFDLVYKNRRVTPFTAAVVKSQYVV